jgi:hypothetical protein
MAIMSDFEKGAENEWCDTGNFLVFIQNIECRDSDPGRR